MAQTSGPIDITHIPELRHLAKDVQASGEPRVLVQGDEEVAVIVPLPSPENPQEKSPADLAAFRAAAGSWKGIVDTEKLKRDITESRRISTRPPVEL